MEESAGRSGAYHSPSPGNRNIKHLVAIVRRGDERDEREPHEDQLVKTVTQMQPSFDLAGAAPTKGENQKIRGGKRGRGKGNGIEGNEMRNRASKKTLPEEIVSSEHNC